MTFSSQKQPRYRYTMFYVPYLIIIFFPIQPSSPNSLIYQNSINIQGANFAILFFFTIFNLNAFEQNLQRLAKIIRSFVKLTKPADRLASRPGHFAQLERKKFLLSLAGLKKTQFCRIWQRKSQLCRMRKEENVSGPITKNLCGNRFRAQRMLLYYLYIVKFTHVWLPKEAQKNLNFVKNIQGE